MVVDYVVGTIVVLLVVVILRLFVSCVVGGRGCGGFNYWFDFVLRLLLAFLWFGLFCLALVILLFACLVLIYFVFCYFG